VAQGGRRQGLFPCGITHIGSRTKLASTPTNQPTNITTHPTITHIQPQVASVQLKDGTSLPADLVVVGVGARPNAELFDGQLKVGCVGW